ncbi:hypothetical protein FOB58_000042 [Candida parapsilosis]|uniref:JAB1/MPN/MOV34 metalloenzyme domain-containing protein n=2 Tax=Candida parapsilosis TaxID=5480 RepID=G8BEU2_CANPC|nr:uncharacterized protein CPAR2_213740 [Candida parapsilosis]KAF6054120.1 hypothetical protein FOB58_000042 [Candida parapsilosis]KAF6056856.1 hypothetical protein FOB59_001368 [Candida parapsilosis]KAF6059791.1 hypothetical protein FOB60_001373 [Candida parapsilosis]KAF6068544.1 hypothetical protein FOB61_001369 [Candida parapsilosis]KAI5902078.1 hypothetical protein K4G60_g1218 [Candida parapsilosis]
MPIVELHSKFLLNVSDIEARKINFHYGVLLGFQDNDKLVVATSFEIIHDDKAIDYEFLYKRYNQLKLVYPGFTILGIYHMNERNSSTIAMFQEIQRCCNSYDIPMNSQQIYVIYDKADEKHPFKSYSAENSQALETTVNTSETENITVSTIEKHKVYFETSGKRQRQPINIKKHIDDVANVVKNLQKLDEKSVNLNKAANSNQTNYANMLKLQTTQLALLTEQKAVLDSAQSNLVRLWQLS